MSCENKIQELTSAIAEFNTEYAKYKTENINASGSKARKALLVAKKAIKAIREDVLTDQKAKKAARKAAKKEKPAE